MMIMCDTGQVQVQVQAMVEQVQVQVVVERLLQLVFYNFSWSGVLGCRQLLGPP